MKKLLISIIGLLATCPAFAEGENVVSSKAYVDANIVTKQPVLTAQSSDNIAMTFPTAVGGLPGQRTIRTSVGSSTSSTDLTTAGAVNAALADKQETMNGTANTVVTYTGTPGGVSQKAVYNSNNAYSGQTNALAEAQHVNAAVQNGFNAFLTCVDPECTLYQVNTLSGTYVPQGN